MTSALVHMITLPFVYHRQNRKVNVQVYGFIYS